MNKPKITVVTVSYNAVNTIEETMLSVLNQTYNNIEYIIIDGGSTDGTVDIIKKYADRLAYWVSEPDKGIYDAMNKGIAVATGDYINFMNAGDHFFREGTIETVFDELIEGDVVYGDTLNISDYCSYVECCLPLRDISKILPFGHQSTFVKAEIIKQNMFDLYFRSAADYNQLFQIWEKGAKFTYIPEIIAVFDARDGFSALNKNIVLKEVAEINGEIQSKCWYRNYKSQLRTLKFKTILKKVLPKFIVKRINIKNIRRNPRFTIYEIY